MLKIPTPERLIVAADFKPGYRGTETAVEDVLKLAESLADTGVVIKLNAVLRMAGYGLLREVHKHGLKTFADLKLVDIGETMATDGMFLANAKPALVTAMCDAGPAGLVRLREMLPETKVLGVTVLTTHSEEDVRRMTASSTIASAVYDRAADAHWAKLAGIICAPGDLPMFRDKYEDFEYVTPNVRPEWSLVAGDDQNKARGATPAGAIRMGATRLVIGRPITGAENPKDAVKRILDEIDSAL